MPDEFAPLLPLVPDGLGVGLGVPVEGVPLLVPAPLEPLVFAPELVPEEPLVFAPEPVLEEPVPMPGEPVALFVFVTEPLL